MFSEAKAAAEIYDERYSAGYDVLYIAPWLRKHRVNLAVLKTIDALKKPDAVWIDTCCGQGWHFTHCDSPGTKIGIDCSAAQLAFARRNNSSARFVCADVLACRFRQKSVSLLTNFWGSYCYFGDAITIAEFFRRCCRAIRPDGALYWEILRSKRWKASIAPRSQKIPGLGSSRFPGLTGPSSTQAAPTA